MAAQLISTASTLSKTIVSIPSGDETENHNVRVVSTQACQELLISRKIFFSGKPLELFQIHRVSLDSTTFAKCVARPPEGRVKVQAENSDG